MTNRAAVGVFVCGFLFAASIAAAPGAMLTCDVSFSEQSLRADEHHLGEGPYSGTAFQLVTLEGLDLIKTLGEPCLPVKVVQVYIPRGKTISRVIVESQSTSALPGEYLLLPGQREIPTSSIEAPEPTPPDESIYGSASPYPSSPVALASEGWLAGRRIASIRVFPIQYVPAERKLLFNQEISFRVELADADPASEPAVPAETPRVAHLRNAIVAGMVENASEVESDFPEDAAPLAGPTAAEYLIICHENHADEYAVLADWKTRKGVPAVIKTWPEVVAAYPGSDDAEKFRNCIKDYYLNHSTMWVVLGGSAPKATPNMRGCYCNVYGTVDAGIPCDLYFAGLDGTWNSDGDSRWGETTDGADLYPDVYVGRLPENTGVQCTTAIHKILTYEGCYTLPTDYQTRMLFMGEWLDAQTDAAINKNMIDNESVPARFDPIQKLYESSGNLNITTAMSALNAGQGIVNHDGHGNVTIISIGPNLIGMDNFMALANGPRYTVFYTLACDPAAFDGIMGCLGRSFVESPNGGGFFVGNSRYGWYWPGASGYGTGDLYDREFFKSMFLRGHYNLGVIHADAKLQRVSYSGDDDTDRWAQFSLNLLGDPETPVWLDTPKTVSVSHPSEIDKGGQTFTVSVTSGGSPVTDARVCLWKGDDIYLVEETAGGSASFQISPADTGTMLVTVSKNGYLPYLGSAQVEDSQSGVEASAMGRLAVRATPNPASGIATLCLSLPVPASEANRPVSVSIYDARGRLVASIKAEAGKSSSARLTWDGRASSGEKVPAGIYFLEASSGRDTARTKLVVLR
jgi:hypothetical protein